ncbi:type II toxin-antitoxin system VapC family toxin [Geodermatophilus sp. SYSU D01176]
MIYFDTSALVKFIKREAESEALRSWRGRLPSGTELATSELAELEISRTLLRAGLDHQRVPYVAGQALRGLYVLDLSRAVLARAKGYRLRELGSLDALHLATAEPFGSELTDFVTYDSELAAAATEVGLLVTSPS